MRSLRQSSRAQRRASLDGTFNWCRDGRSAPSGAHVQPWRFVVVTDPEVRTRLRSAAEAEEREFYERRASPEWLAALARLGTDAEKPFLVEAPGLIAVFEVHQGPDSPKPYYVKESVGIAVGFLLAALHLAGLSTLTHTPSPMRFLNEILDRPREERGSPPDPGRLPGCGRGRARPRAQAARRGSSSAAAAHRPLRQRAAVAPGRSCPRRRRRRSRSCRRAARRSAG